MAATAGTIKSSALPNGEVLVYGDATLSNSYTSLGETLDLSSKILNSSTPVLAGFSSNSAYALGWSGNAASGAFHAYNGNTLAEVANSTDLSGVNIKFVFIGQAP